MEQQESIDREYPCSHHLVGILVYLASKSFDYLNFRSLLTDREYLSPLPSCMADMLHEAPNAFLSFCRDSCAQPVPPALNARLHGNCAGATA